MSATVAPLPGVRLTPRETEVLRLVAAGETTTAIARALGLSANTVKAHIARMIVRTGAPDRAALVAFGIRARLVPVVRRPGVSLDPAERRLIGLIGQGLRSREIAGRLRTTVPALAYRVKVLMARLGAVDRAHLVLCAAEAGFMPPGPGGRL